MDQTNFSRVLLCFGKGGGYLFSLGLATLLRSLRQQVLSMVTLSSGGLNEEAVIISISGCWRNNRGE